MNDKGSDRLASALDELPEYPLEIIVWSPEHKVFATYLPDGSTLHPVNVDAFKYPGSDVYQRRSTRVYALEAPDHG